MMIRSADPRVSHQGTAPRVRGELSDVASALHARVEKSATAVGMNITPWLRQMVRQITLAELPASWQEECSEERSHDSRTSSTRFMLRLNDPTREKLEELSAHFDKPAADIMRQLIVQVAPDDFPSHW